MSDAPEVHSNGFHVTFSRKEYGNLGMVLPRVVPSYDGADLPSQLGMVPASTIIRLPLIIRSSPATGGATDDGGTDQEEEGAIAAATAAVVESLRKRELCFCLDIKQTDEMRDCPVLYVQV